MVLGKIWHVGLNKIGWREEKDYMLNENKRIPKKDWKVHSVVKLVMLYYMRFWVVYTKLEKRIMSVAKILMFTT